MAKSTVLIAMRKAVKGMPVIREELVKSPLPETPPMPPKVVMPPHSFEMKEYAVKVACGRVAGNIALKRGS